MTAVTVLATLASAAVAAVTSYRLGYSAGRTVPAPKPPAPRPANPAVRVLGPMSVYDWETDG